MIHCWSTIVLVLFWILLSWFTDFFQGFFFFLVTDGPVGQLFHLIRMKHLILFGESRIERFWSLKQYENQKIKCHKNFVKEVLLRFLVEGMTMLLFLFNNKWYLSARHGMYSSTNIFRWICNPMWGEEDVKSLKTKLEN